MNAATSITPGKSLMKVLALVAAAVIAIAMAGATLGCSSKDAPEIAPDPTTVQVPNLISLEKQDAAKQIANSGLAMGDVTYDYSDTVPNGHVISQDPAALTQVEKATKVNLTVSKGQQEPADTTVPDLTGKSQTDAEKALQDAKLTPVQSNAIISSATPPGTVCEQSIPAGTTVKEGTQVTFAIALAPDTIAVPNEVGKTQDDAQADLTQAGLGSDISQVYSSNIDAGLVITQSVAPGTKVATGTVVTLQISLGPQPPEQVTVPDIMTYTLEDAEAALDSAGLAYRYTGDEDGTVVSMDPAAGTEVDAGSTVTFSLQHASTLVAVPDVAGMTGDDAFNAMDAAGLDLDYDTDNPDKTLQGTNPAAGTQVDIGSVVEAVYPPEPTPPDPGEDGAWESKADGATVTIDDDDKKVCEAALKDGGLKGYKPVATLATQVVKGTNYAFLCADKSNWYVVEAYEDLDGTVTYNSGIQIDPGNVATGGSSGGGAGGWEVNGDCGSSLPGDAQDAFDDAMDNYQGNEVDPVALLGTQVVSGMNYEVLCVDDTLYAALIYVDASGNAQVSSMDPFDLASYLD